MSLGVEMTISTNLRIVIGFILKIFGIGWTLMDKFICDYLCGGKCGVIQNNNCSLLLLFVGIIFVVCGYALIVMNDKRRIRFEKKLIDDFIYIFK
ncbi:MAG: hypothetical protein AABW90_03865 [Nanoarchaeota archaeon]